MGHDSEESGLLVSWAWHGLAGAGAVRSCPFFSIAYILVDYVLGGWVGWGNNVLALALYIK